MHHPPPPPVPLQIVDVSGAARVPGAAQLFPICFNMQAPKTGDKAVAIANNKVDMIPFLSGTGAWTSGRVRPCVRGCCCGLPA